jgi:putative tail protein
MPPTRGRVYPPGYTPPVTETVAGTTERIVRAIGGRPGGTVVIPPRGGGGGTTPLPGPFPTQPPPTDIGPNPDSPDHTTTESQRTRTLTFGAVGQAIPMRYGRTEAGGDVFFARTVGEKLYIGISVSQGELGGWVRDTIDGKTFAEVGITRVNRYVGTASQTTPPTLLAEAGYPGIHNRRAFVEYVAERQSDLLSAIDPKNYRSVVDGIKVRDWNQDATLVTRYISDNPVWALADWMTRRHPDHKWGLGCTDGMIRWGTSWATAATACAAAMATGPSAPGTAPTVVEHTAQGGLYIPLANIGYQYVQVNRKADGSRSTASPLSTAFSPTRDRSSALVTMVAGSAGTTVRELYRTRRNQPSTAGPMLKVLETAADPTLSVQVQDTKEDWQLTMVVPTASTSGRFRIGAVIDQRMGAREMIERFCTLMCATVVWQGGGFDIYVDGTQSDSGISFVDGEGELVDTLRLRSKSRREIPTKVTVGYTDADNNFKPATVSWPQPDDTNLDLGAGTVGAKPRVEWTFDLRDCPSRDCATRIAAHAWARGNVANYEVDWGTNQKGVQVLPIGSLVTVISSKLGFLPALLKVTRMERVPNSLVYMLTGEPPITLYDTFSWIELSPTPPLNPPPPREEPPETLQVLRYTNWIRTPAVEIAP